MIQLKLQILQFIREHLKKYIIINNKSRISKTR